MKKPLGRHVAEKIIEDQDLEVFDRELIERCAWRRVSRMKPDSIFRLIWWSDGSEAFAGGSVNSSDDPRTVVKKVAVEVIIGYAHDLLPFPSDIDGMPVFVLD